jgi:hypothetical protein
MLQFGYSSSVTFLCKSNLGFIFLKFWKLTICEVFHRGVGVDQTENLLIMEKLDVIITGFLLGIYKFGLKIVGQGPRSVPDSEKVDDQ